MFAASRRDWLRAFGALLGAAVVPSHAVEAVGKIKLLIVTGGHGFEVEPFFRIFQDNPEIVFTAARHGKAADVYEREDLLSYDVVLLYDMPKEITEAQKARFAALLERGTGLFVLHHALVSYPQWPEYERIIGGRYLQADEKSGKAGYRHDVEIPVEIADAAHPITQGLANLSLRDEIYWGFRVSADSAPLLRTTNAQSGNPIAWARTEGKSRVFYLQLGHGPTAYAHPQFREIVARAIRWVARR
jgi:uncharacterized protein